MWDIFKATINLADYSKAYQTKIKHVTKTSTLENYTWEKLWNDNVESQRVEIRSYSIFLSISIP